jgi:hypothetical protein
MWVLLAFGVMLTGFGVYNEVAARWHRRRADPVLSIGLASGPFLCLLAGNEVIVEAATGQRSFALDVATGVAAIAGGVFLMYRTIRW